MLHGRAIQGDRTQEDGMLQKFAGLKAGIARVIAFRGYARVLLPRTISRDPETARTSDSYIKNPYKGGNP